MGGEFSKIPEKIVWHEGHLRNKLPKMPLPLPSIIESDFDSGVE